MALPREHQEEETLGKADPLTGGLGFFYSFMRSVCGLRTDSSIGTAASIGTEVGRYYCRTGIFGRKLELSMQFFLCGSWLEAALPIIVVDPPLL